MTLPDIHTLWIGDSLPMLAKLTLASFLRCGHPVFLHTYNEYSDVPSGVIQVDAGKTLPESEVSYFSERKRLAFFADLFRYHLLNNGADIWSDCDVFCVKPLPKQEYLFGFADGKTLNTSVLSMPPGSALVSKMIEHASDRFFIPPWGNKNKNAYLKLRKSLGMPRRTVTMRWGVIGPDLLNYAAKETDTVKFALAHDYLYPLHYRLLPLLFDPGLNIEDLITPRTYCIHLYNEMWGAYRTMAEEAEPSSPYGQMLDLVKDFLI